MDTEKKPHETGNAGVDLGGKHRPPAGGDMGTGFNGEVERMDKPAGVNPDRVIFTGPIDETPVDIGINFDVDWQTLSEQIHQFNVLKGWWDGFENKIDRYETCMMLIVSELSEAIEGCRKNLMDDKLPQYPMFDVELADAMIRLLDVAGSIDFTFGCEPLQSLIIRMQMKTKPEQLWVIVKNLAGDHGESAVLVNAMNTIASIAHIHDIDLRLMIQKKMEFNAVRADHLRENRAKENGKRF